MSSDFDPVEHVESSQFSLDDRGSRTSLPDPGSAIPDDTRSSPVIDGPIYSDAFTVDFDDLVSTELALAASSLRSPNCGSSGRPIRRQARSHPLHSGRVSIPISDRDSFHFYLDSIFDQLDRSWITKLSFKTNSKRKNSGVIVWWSGNQNYQAQHSLAQTYRLSEGVLRSVPKSCFPSSPCVPVGWAVTLFWVTWGLMLLFLCLGRSSTARKSSRGWNSTCWLTSVESPRSACQIAFSQCVNLNPLETF